MVSKKLQKKWKREAEKFGREGEIFKIFTNYYSPALIANFFSMTKEEADKIVETETEEAKILGLFAETWRLAIKKSCPPCCEADFLSLLSEAAIIWEKNGCKGVTIETLRNVWSEI